MFTRRRPLPLNLVNRIRQLWRGDRPARQRRRRIHTRLLAAADVLEERILLAAGDLDPTFGGDGTVTTDFESGSVEAGRDVAIQADGSILVVGSTTAGGADVNFAVARYNPDGSPDASWRFDGTVATDVAGGNDFAEAVAIQADGKVLVAGTAISAAGTDVDFALVRYNVDGTLDDTFGINGRVTTDFSRTPGVGLSPEDRAFAMALQADGKIVVGGESDGDFALARYNTDGSLDPSFDGDGKVTTHFATFFSIALFVQIEDLVIQPDGQILVAGSRLGADGPDFIVARYNSNDGSLDTSFDTDGVIITATQGNRARSLALHADGRIVVAGGEAVAVYNSDGSLDHDFDADGKLALDSSPDGFQAIADVTIQQDGRIVVAGFNQHQAGFAGIFQVAGFALARIRDDGSLDPTFSSDGVASLDFGDSGARAVTLDSGGRIVVAGGHFKDFGIARFLIDYNLGPFTQLNLGPLNGSQNLLSLAGTSGDDTITVKSGPGGSVEVTTAAGVTSFFNVQAIELNLGDGDDTVVLDDLPASATVDLGDGNDSLTISADIDGSRSLPPVSAHGGPGGDEFKVEGNVKPGDRLFFNPQPEPPGWLIELLGEDGDDKLQVMFSSRDPRGGGGPLSVESLPTSVALIFDGGRGNDSSSVQAEGVLVPQGGTLAINTLATETANVELNDFHTDGTTQIGGDGLAAVGIIVINNKVGPNAMQTISGQSLGDLTLNAEIRDVEVDGQFGSSWDFGGLGTVGIVVINNKIGPQGEMTIGGETSGDLTLNSEFQQLDVQGRFGSSFDVGGGGEVGIVIINNKIGPQGEMMIGGETSGDLTLNSRFEQLDVQGQFGSSFDVGGGGEVGIVVINNKIGPQGEMTIGGETSGDLTLNSEFQQLDVQGRFGSSFDVGGGGEVGIIVINNKIGPLGQAAFGVDANEGNTNPSMLSFRGDSLDIAGHAEIDFRTGLADDHVEIRLENSAVTSSNSLRGSVRTGDGNDQINVTLTDNHIDHGHRAWEFETGDGQDTLTLTSLREILTESSLSTIDVDLGTQDDAASFNWTDHRIASDSIAELIVHERSGRGTLTVSTQNTEVTQGSTQRIAIYGDGDADTISVTADNSSARAGGSIETTLDGGHENDSISVARTGSEVLGGSKDYTLVQGGNGDDRIESEITDARIREGSTQVSTMDGAGGDDTILVRESSIVVETGGHFATNIDGGSGNNDIRREGDGPGPAKFLVPDPSALSTFLYDNPPAVNFVGVQPLDAANTVPRGAAQHPDGSRYYTVDQTGRVFVYDALGNPLGSWTARRVDDPEGIATDGANIYIVDNGSDEVLRYDGGASFLSGKQEPDARLPLAAPNDEPRGITTDGTRLWVVDDQARLDTVYVYSVTGTPLGQWVIDPLNNTPTGITIDPLNVQNIWTVDARSLQIFQYDAAAGNTSGTQNATTAYALAAGNVNPQGLADPPPADAQENFDPPVPQSVADPTTQQLLFTNPDKREDVNDDGFVTALDALVIVNLLNRDGAAELESSIRARAALGNNYYDVNGDAFVAPNDVLLVINEINSLDDRSAEGEPTPTAEREAGGIWLPAAERQTENPTGEWQYDAADDDDLVALIALDQPHVRPQVAPQTRVVAESSSESLELDGLLGLDLDLDDLADDIARHHEPG